MKYVKILLVVVLFGVIGYAIYWYTTKRKTTASGGTASEPPPTATPPIAGLGFVDPNSGAGLSAIDRRESELLSSSAAAEIQDSVRSEINILNGVSEAKKAYYDQNISREPITSARNVPFNLTPVQKSVLRAFTTIDTSTGGENTANNLLSANRQMLAELSTCFIGNPELENTREFMKQVYCQGYIDCGKNYRDLGAAPNMLKGGQMAGADMAKMAQTWLSGSELFDAKLRERAINDLRGQGWKFTGFDF